MEIYQRNRLQTLAIVILNFNGTQWFKKFLSGIVNFSQGYPIYVIDNHSTDDSLNYLQVNYPEIEVIKNPKNLGYAGGYNHGLKEVKEEIYCLLNSDVQVTPNWIDPILKLFQEDGEIVAVQPKILSYKEKNKFEFAGAAGGFLDNLGYPFCRGRVFFSTEEDICQYNNTCEIFWATGACLFIRKKSFWEQNGFDEDFFAHMEEIDLCWRLKNSGKKIFYCAESQVYHVGGGTLNPYNPTKTFLNFRNNHLMLLKNLPSYKIFPIIFFRLILDGLAGIKFIFTDGWKHCWAVIRAHFAFYYLIPKFLKKRNPGIKNYGHKKFIVFQYFFYKRKTYKKLR